LYEWCSRCTTVGGEVFSTQASLVAVPYQFQGTHTLSPLDFLPRQEFSQWFLRQCGANLSLSGMCCPLTNQACKNRHTDLYNRHFWSCVVPHSTVQCRHQQRSLVNVFDGILGHCFVGPYVLPRRLSGAAYRHLLEHSLPGLLDAVPLHI
jgi:hypothetical protein